MIDRVMNNDQFVARFYAQVTKRPDGCWLYRRGWTTQGGYRTLIVPLAMRPRYGRHAYAHRLSWVFAEGRPVPDGMYVCHRCDVPDCVNPEHLFLGTPRENVADAIAKGRLRPGCTFRRTKPRRKLTVEQVREIRATYRTGRWPSIKAQAAHYGVGRAAISNIMSGRSWKETA